MSEVEGNTLAWPEAETPTVPASTGGGGLDVGGLLKQIQGDTATQQNLMRQAITPVSGQHVGQIPSSMLRPTNSASEQPLDHRQMVGAKAAKGQGIANLLTSAGNVISKAVAAERQQKQAHLTDAATKLFTAQAAIDEAQQQHDSATAIGDNATAAKAQELITKNTAVRDGITSDPKLRKALAKGLNINYIDPSENKTEEHDAVKKAIQNAKTMQEKKQLAKQAQQQHQQQANQQGAQNFGTAFAKSQPQTMAPNQMAQAQYAAYMEAQKANAAATKALMPLLSAQVRANNTASLEQRREDHADAVSLFKSQDAWDRMHEQINARQDLAKTQFGYRLKEIAATGSKDLATFKAKLSLKGADSAVQLKAYQEFQTKTAVTKASLAKTVSELQIQRAQAEQKHYNASIVSNLDQQLETAKQAQTTFGQAADSLMKEYSKKADVKEGGASSGSTSGTSSSLNSASTWLSDTAADPDEDDENY